MESERFSECNEMITAFFLYLYLSIFRSVNYKRPENSVGAIPKKKKKNILMNNYPLPKKELRSNFQNK